MIVIKYEGSQQRLQIFLQYQIVLKYPSSMPTKKGGGLVVDFTLGCSEEAKEPEEQEEEEADPVRSKP